MNEGIHLDLDTEIVNASIIPRLVICLSLDTRQGTGP